MTRVHVSVMQVLLLLGVACGLRGLALAEDTEMIVGGTPAPDGKYPWQVRLYNSMGDSKGFCGGTLIADQWVLTAGHCAVVNHELPANLVPVDKIIVGYGSTDRTKTSKIKSEKIIVHPDYIAHGASSATDIALIKLSKSIPHAAAVPLANPDLDKQLVPPGTKVIITGWGAVWDPEDKDVTSLISELTSPGEMVEKVNFPLKLHEVEVQVMDSDTCQAALHPLKIASTEICVMRPGTPKNSCYGDSGGPLVVPADNARGYVQVGVVSWGVSCGREGTPNVFARVASFSDWINNTMNSN